MDEVYMKTFCMRRILAVAVIAATLLCLLPASVLPAAAADVEGDWTVSRRANDYKDPDPITGEEHVYCPAPGYEYTREGFTTIPASYKNTTPFFNVQSKEKHSLKDGLYLKFRIDDFSYGGEDNSADHWIALSFWDRLGLGPGGTKYGSGFISLLRGPGGGGSTTAQSCPSLIDTEEKKGFFNVSISHNFTPELDSEGREIYTLEVEWDGSGYVIKICGTTFTTCAEVTNHLESVDPTGEFHVGITLNSGVKDGVGSLTILKYGQSEADATTPVGTDSAEPEANINVIAPLADSSTVPAGQPALLWDVTTMGSAGGTNVELIAQGDNSFHVVASQVQAYFDWNVKRSLSYKAQDFPVYAILFRNYWNMGGELWYCTEDIMKPQDDCRLPWSVYDETTIEYEDEQGNTYSLVIVDLSGEEQWKERINRFRITFNMDDITDPELCEWDICYMGAFRSVEDAQNYGYAYLNVDPDATAAETEETEGAPTEAPTDPVTEAPTEPVTEAPTEAPMSPESETEISESGCGSVIGLGTVAILTAAAAAVALKRKD